MNLEQLAREAGLTDPDLGPWMIDYGNAEDAIKRFAALVLEEAAKVFRTVSDSTGDYPIKPSDAEAAIRALAAQKG